MTRTLFAALALVSLVATVVATSAAVAHDHQQAPKLENLLRSELKRVDNTEVIVSRVVLPPNAVLPTHWHPGEEFAYVISGAVTLKQRGKEDVTGRAGEAMQVPLKQIHSAKASAEGAVILVFRVHEKGQPERVLVP